MSLAAEAAAGAALSITAPAKINLTLRVTGRRADGYHLLDSLVVFTELGDELSVRAPVADEAALSLTVDGPFAAPLNGESDNLVLRAARHLAEDAQIVPQAAFTLTKRLPVASGIGGGSADAAAALHLLNDLWGLERSLAELQALALPLGADIPVCLLKRPTMMRGIGETLLPLDRLPDFALLLVNPGAALSTAEIFAARQGTFTTPTPPSSAFTALDALIDWLSLEANDLEEPARRLCPAVGEVLEALGRTAGCRLARMSGSGATCFGLYATLAEAEAAAEAVARAYPAWWVAASRCRSASP